MIFNRNIEFGTDSLSVITGSVVDDNDLGIWGNVALGQAVAFSALQLHFLPG